MAKIQYNSEVKILSIRFQDKKSVESDIKDNVVLDYDEDGHLVNIDVMEVDLEDLIRTNVEEKPAHLSETH